MTAMPRMATVMLAHVRGDTRSRIKSQPNMAENRGIQARMTSVLATVVVSIANTKPMFAHINPSEAHTPGQPRLVTMAAVRPRYRSVMNPMMETKMPNVRRKTICQCPASSTRRRSRPSGLITSIPPADRATPLR